MSRSVPLRKPYAVGAILAAAVTLSYIGTSVDAGRFAGQGRSVGGIAVNTNGVVQQVKPADQNEYLKRLRQNTQRAAEELNLPTELRKVSLRGLQAALQDAVNNRGGRLPDEVKYLAGLQRIQYVLVYPELNDIVLAGPGEGWKVDDNAQIVGISTGQPVLQLDDLLVAFRSVSAARREGISVSIDPTEEGRRNFEQFMRNQRTFNPRVVQGIERAMGPQQITYTGIPTNTHFAHVLMAADYRMKRLAMKLDPTPVQEMPSFLDLLQAKQQLPSNAMPRWWMACNYEPIAHSDDRLVWELRGPGVKAMTEDELVQADGTVVGTGQEDPIAKEWADRMTAQYEELAKKEIVFAELRNMMDICVVAALIESEDLAGMAGGGSFPLVTGQGAVFAVENWSSAKTVPTVCSFLKVGRNYVITASGGVQIESWDVAERTEVDTAVGEVHGKAAKPADSSWFWN